MRFKHTARAKIPATYGQDQKFTGINLFPPSHAIAEGFLTQADNVYIDGTELVSRHGKIAILATAWVTSPTGGNNQPNYCPLAWVNVDSSVDIYFANGPASGAGGKLWKVAKAGGTPVEVKLGGITSLNLYASQVQMTKANGKICLVDGNGALLLIDPAAGNASILTALNLPSYGLSVQPTNFPIDQCTTAASWTVSGYPTSLANILTNSSFETLTGTHANNWNIASGDPDCYANGDSHLNGLTTPFGTTVMQLDGGSGGTKDAVWQTSTPVTLSDGSGNHPKVHQFSIYGHNAGGADQIAAVTLTGNFGVSNTVPLATQNLSWKTDPSTTGWSVMNVLADFSAYNFDITNIRVDIAQLSPTQSSSCLYIDNVSLIPLDAQLIVTQNGTHGIQIGATSTYVKGAFVTQDYGTGGKDFSPKSGSTIGFGFALRGLSGNPPIKVQMKGAASTGDSNLYDVPVKFSQDGTYFNLDTTNVPVATLAAIRNIYITFTDNLPANDPKLNLTNLFIFGPIVNAGNLTNPAFVASFQPYVWYVTEVNNLGDATLVNIIESDPGSPTPPDTPTGLLAAANITIPAGAPTNSNVTHYYFYRQGGTFTDGLCRLVAIVPVGSDVAYGADTLDSPPNPTFSWNHTTKVLLDNTPDSFLQTNYTFLILGRTPAITGAQYVTYWQNRVWISKGSDVYSSWLVTAAKNASLYFNQANLPDDPNSSIKGYYFTITPTDNDAIQAMVPYGTTLFFLKTRSVSMVAGIDPSYWQQSTYLVSAGVGCLAPRSACIVGNKVWFVGPNSVYEFDGDMVDPTSLPIEKLINPVETGGNPIAATAYAGIAAVYHGRRYHMFAPTNADSNNTVDYVYDGRTNGFTRWLLGNITSATSLSSGVDTDNMICAGADGQIYLIDPTKNYDQATVGGAQAAITITVTGRAYGLELQGEDYFRENQATRLMGFVKSGETVSLQCNILNQKGTVYPLPAQTISSGDTTRLWLKPTSDSRGHWLQVQMTCSSVKQFRITSWALYMSEGRIGL